MRRAQIVLAVWIALSSAGCMLRGKQQTAAATPPPTPAPVARPAQTTPRPQPLSIPQTQAQLPPAQPISPEAMATLQPPPAPVESPAEPRAPRRPPVPPAGPAAPGRPEATPAAQTQTPPATPPVEAEPRPTVQEIVAPAELKRLQDSADGRKQEIRKVLEQAQAHGLSRDQREIVTRIQSFVQLSDDAEKRGDMRLADALAERGQLLVRELQNGAR